MRLVTRYPRTVWSRVRFIIFDADTEAVEIMMSAWMLLLSAAFFLYGPAIINNPSWVVLGAIAPLQVWAFGTLIIGVSN